MINNLINKIDDIKENLTSMDYLEIMGLIKEVSSNDAIYKTMYQNEKVLNTIIIKNCLANVLAKDIIDGNMYNYVVYILSRFFINLEYDDSSYSQMYERLRTANMEILSYDLD